MGKQINPMSKFRSELKTLAKSIDDHVRMLQIDETDIDRVVSSHPALFYVAGELSSECIALRDTIKDILSTSRNEIYLLRREEADALGKKLTEAHLSSMVDSDEEVIFGKEILVEANRLVALSQSLRDAFSQRSFAIRDIVSLTVSNAVSVNGIQSASNERYEGNRARIAKHRQSKG